MGWKEATTVRSGQEIRGNRAAVIVSYLEKPTGLIVSFTPAILRQAAHNGKEEKVEVQHLRYDLVEDYIVVLRIAKEIGKKLQTTWKEERARLESSLGDVIEESLNDMCDRERAEGEKKREELLRRRRRTGE